MNLSTALLCFCVFVHFVFYLQFASCWKRYLPQYEIISKMNLSTAPLSPFQIPYFKNAKVVKREITPFLQNIIYNYTQPLSFENEPFSIETIPLIREHLDTYLFYIRYRNTTITTKYPTFQISFPQQGSSSHQIYRRTINPINLLTPIREVFQAFLRTQCSK